MGSGVSVPNKPLTTLNSTPLFRDPEKTGMPHEVSVYQGPSGPGFWSVLKRGRSFGHPHVGTSESRVRRSKSASEAHSVGRPQSTLSGPILRDTARLSQ